MASSPAPLDEPKTPMWLPAVGAALFLTAGVWFMTRPSEAPPQQLDQATVDAGAEGGDAGR